MTLMMLMMMLMTVIAGWALILVFETCGLTDWLCYWRRRSEAKCSFNMNYPV
jgi:hypothetical protein